MMWYWGNGGVHWWGALFMGVGVVAFWGLIIWAVWALFSSLSRRPDGSHRPPDAMAILDERLARGEIDAEEYRSRRDLIANRTSAGNGRARTGAGESR